MPIRPTSRRDFLRTSAALPAAALAASLPRGGFHARGREEVRVGVVGCGGRGTGAAWNCVEADPAVRITALGDLFEDRLRTSRTELLKLGERVELPEERCYTGWDAWSRVFATDVDLVILATPPGFRPAHLEAAIAAGKHVFMEKPVAVDPVGVRRVIAAGEEASRKGRAIVAGTQRRHDPAYRDIIARIHDGAIGEIVGGQCWWDQDGLWKYDRQPGQSDVEWQVRNWLYFDWLSGDHICEQHIHNIDVLNWVKRGPPASAIGHGGRQVRTDAAYGNVFDHFAIEFTWPDGTVMTSTARQIDGTHRRVGERIVGTKGVADPQAWIHPVDAPRQGFAHQESPYVLEHRDLLQSIRDGKPLNEARRVAESTLTAIMGRTAAYTGKQVTWDFMLKSVFDLSPAQLSFGDLPVRPVPVPGRTPLI